MTDEPPTVPRDRHADADRLSRQSLQQGDATGWFERLYAEAASGEAVIPWDRGAPHPLLVNWAEQHRARGARTADAGRGVGHG